jgi:hypothetical protein
VFNLVWPYDFYRNHILGKIGFHKCSHRLQNLFIDLSLSYTLPISFLIICIESLFGYPSLLDFSTFDLVVLPNNLDILRILKGYLLQKDIAFLSVSAFSIIVSGARYGIM